MHLKQCPHRKSKVVVQQLPRQQHNFVSIFREVLHKHSLSIQYIRRRPASSLLQNVVFANIVKLGPVDVALAVGNKAAIAFVPKIAVVTLGEVILELFFERKIKKRFANVEESVASVRMSAPSAQVERSR